LAIDFFDKSGSLVSAEQMTAIALGCRAGMHAIGPFAGTVKVIRVTFVSFPGQTDLTGPVLRFVYEDPLDVECSHTTDYRFIGAGGTCPKPEDIVTMMKTELIKQIKEHLKRAEARMKNAQARMERLETSEHLDTGGLGTLETH